MMRPTKEEIPLLRLGVVFCLLLVFSMAPCFAMELWFEGDVLKDAEFETVYRLRFQEDFSSVHGVGGAYTWGSSRPAAFSDWLLTTKRAYGTFYLHYNGSHATSLDPFRLVHANAHSKDSLVLRFADSKGQFRAVLALRLPASTSLDAYVAQVEWSKEKRYSTLMYYDTGHRWTAFGDNWDFARQQGIFGVVQTQRAFATGSLTASFGLALQNKEALGIQTVELSQAAVLQLRMQEGKHRGTLGFEFVHEGFRSPFARSVPFRQGITGSYQWREPPYRVELSLDYYTHRRAAAVTLFYEKAELKLALWPNPQFRLEHPLGPLRFQWAFEDTRVRMTYERGYGKVIATLRYSGPYRVEWSYKKAPWEFRTVFRWHPTSLAYLYFLSGTLKLEKSFLQLSLGADDRGNLDAHREFSPRITVKWGFAF